MADTLNSQIEALPDKVSVSVFERIKALLLPTADEKLTKLQADLQALTTQLTQSAADLATAKATIASLQTAAKASEGEKATLTTKVTELETRNAKLETDMKDFDARASTKAREICAAQGIPVDKVPDQATNDATTSVDKLMAEYHAEADPAKKAALWANKVKPALGYK